MNASTPGWRPDVAGIGWRLERLIERDSLGASLGAFLTGVAVTSGPWLLTTLVLVIMRLSALGGGVAGASAGERVITIVYALVIVLSAPIDIVLSRYAADRVYEGRRGQIAGPLRRLVAASLIAFTVIGAAAMWIADVEPALAAPGAALAAVVGAQWLLLSAAGGLSSPAIILRAFGLGAPISVLAVVVLARADVLGPAGYLIGYGVGQVATLAMLLAGTLQALPAIEDEDARIGPAFAEYWLLGAAAFGFHAGLWIDKLVVFALAGGAAASTYAAIAAVAWLSVVPACAYLFIAVETSFHRRFQAYYQGLTAGASLATLERRAAEVEAEIARTLRGTAVVQVGVTLIALAATPAIAGGLGLDAAGASALMWLLLGAGLQVVAMAATLLLYYFDFRREAAIAALTQLIASGTLTALIGAPSPLLGLGYALACGLTCAAALVQLRRCVAGLLERTFQSQPFLSEDYARE